MDQILKDFGVQPILLIAQIVNFFILLLLLKKFLYGPILKVLEKRQETIAHGLKNAEEIERRLEKTAEDREKELEKAAREARRILDEATKTAVVVVAEAHIKAQGEMEVTFKKGQEAISLEREKMQQEIKEEVSEMVGKSVSKVLEGLLDKDLQKKIAETAIKNL